MRATLAVVVALAGASQTGNLSPVAAGIITGTVLIHGPASQPAAGVVVSASLEEDKTWTVTSSAQGTFRFDNLPVGRYVVAARGRGFIDSHFGAAAPGGPGVPIALGAAQEFGNADISIRRGGIISGTVRRAIGTSVPDVAVSLISATSPIGLGQTAVTTDSDQNGNYRFSGLAPGRYVVCVRVPLTNSSPSIKQVPRENPGTEGWSNGLLFGLNQLTLTELATIQLGVGEETPGIDITLTAVQGRKISGRVVQPGTPDAVVTVVPIVGEFDLSSVVRPRQTQVAADGYFSFASVAPGRYLVIARAIGGPANTLVTTVPVEVNATDVELGSVVLRDALRLRGNVSRDFKVAGLSGKSTFRVQLLSADGFPTLSTMVAANGSFEVNGIIPGRYWLRIADPTELDLVSSATIGDCESLDRPCELATLRDNQANIIISSRRTGISGIMRGSLDKQLTVIVFPHDERLWVPKSRHVRVVRPATDGGFRITDCPPGPYHLALISDLPTPDGLTDVLFRQLRTGAVSVVLRSGEVLVQDLRVMGRATLRDSNARSPKHR